MTSMMKTTPQTARLGMASSPLSMHRLLCATVVWSAVAVRAQTGAYTGVIASSDASVFSISGDRITMKPKNPNGPDEYYT